MKRGLFSFAMMLFLMACRPATIEPSTATAVPIPTAVSLTTATFAPTAVADTSTLSPTIPPTIAPTRTAVNTATTMPTPTATGTPTPVATATVTTTAVSTTFKQDLTFPAVPVKQLWLAPDGRPWAITAAALYAYRDGQWAVEQPGRAAILGIDTEQRAWALLADTLAVYTEAAGWQRYGPAWDWDALSNPEDDVGGLAVDRQGRVWVAHGRNGLHRFDPATQQWQTLRAADLGYGSPPEEELDFAAYDPHLAFTDVVLDSFGNIWASACPLLLWEDGPIAQQLRDGDGVRWFDGAGWQGPDASAARCIWDMAVDGQGRIWFAGPKNDLWRGENDLLRYAPGSGWEWLPVPENEERFGARPSFASRIWLDDSGVPWVFVERRGGASFPAPGLYFEQNGRWQTAADELGGTVAFGPDGQVWAFAWDVLFVNDVPYSGLQRFQNGMWTAILAPPDLFDRKTLLLVDGNGRFWFTGPDGDSIWYYADNR